MSAELKALLVMRGFISHIEQEDQEKIWSAYNNLKDILEDSGDEGEIAFGMLALEVAIAG